MKGGLTLRSIGRPGNPYFGATLAKYGNREGGMTLPQANCSFRRHQRGQCLPLRCGRAGAKQRLATRLPGFQGEQYLARNVVPVLCACLIIGNKRSI
jgi:hypothetical protein